MIPGKENTMIDRSSVIKQLYHIDKLLYKFMQDRRCDRFSSSASILFDRLSRISRREGLFAIAVFSESVASLFNDIAANNVNCYEELRYLTMVVRIEMLDQLDDYSDGVQVLRAEKGESLLNSFRQDWKLLNDSFADVLVNHENVHAEELLA